jgi:hypothetical protein
MTETGDYRLRPAAEWEQEEGVTVRDPDGWRAGDVEWDLPITVMEFRRLCATSTVEDHRLRRRHAPARPAPRTRSKA